MVETIMANLVDKELCRAARNTVLLLGILWLACGLRPRRAVLRHCLLVRGLVRRAPLSAVEITKPTRPVWIAVVPLSLASWHVPDRDQLRRVGWWLLNQPERRENQRVGMATQEPGTRRHR